MTSQSRAIRSQSHKIVKCVKFWVLICFNCESTCDLTDVSASIYDIKIDARPFDTIHDILRGLSLAQSLFKGRNARLCRKQEPTLIRLSGTDRLRVELFWIEFEKFAVPGKFRCRSICREKKGGRRAFCSVWLPKLSIREAPAVDLQIENIRSYYIIISFTVRLFRFRKILLWISIKLKTKR